MQLCTFVWQRTSLYKSLFCLFPSNFWLVFYDLLTYFVFIFLQFDLVFTLFFSRNDIFHACFFWLNNMTFQWVSFIFPSYILLIFKRIDRDIEITEFWEKSSCLATNYLEFYYNNIYVCLFRMKFGKANLKQLCICIVL